MYFGPYFFESYAGHAITIDRACYRDMLLHILFRKVEDLGLDVAPARRVISFILELFKNKVLKVYWDTFTIFSYLRRHNYDP